MIKLSIREALSIAEKIDHGRTDYLTLDPRYAPLWQHHFLRESFLAMLRHHGTGSSDFHRANFRNICSIMAPEFLSILGAIQFDQIAVS